MIFKSESYILRKYDLTETSYIVYFFAREMGLLKLVAKGAKRGKSPFSGCLEVFNKVEIEYSKKEHNELGTLRKIDLLESNLSLFSNYENSKVLFLISETISKGIKEEQKDEEIYRLLTAVLEASKKESPSEWVLNYFFLWFLKLNGIFPSPKSCEVCGAKNGIIAFNSEKGGFLCYKCHNKEDFLLKEESVEIIREFLKIHPTKLVEKKGRNFPQDLQNMLYLKINDFLGATLKSV